MAMFHFGNSVTSSITRLVVHPEHVRQGSPHKLLDLRRRCMCRLKEQNQQLSASVVTSPSDRNLGVDGNLPSRSRHCAIKTENVSECRNSGSNIKPTCVGDENFFDSDYYFEGMLRKVYPYRYTYKSFCKARWKNKTVSDVFCKEFAAGTRNSEYIARRIQLGSIAVNGKTVTDGDSVVLQNNDFIECTTHKHEFPVLGCTLPIIHMSDDWVVIDKPPSLPVHPGGRFRHNSIVFVLAKEFGLNDLHVGYRLDRLASGVLILPKTPESAKLLKTAIYSRNISKEYICRVEGNFPDGLVTVNQPIDILSYKVGIGCVGPAGKPSTTQFRKLSYNGKSSVVLCKPVTGRMHQIRIHLQFLGYPIVNDPIYNNVVFGPEKGRNGEFGKSKEQLVKDLLEDYGHRNWCIDSSNDKSSPIIGNLGQHSLNNTDSSRERFKENVFFSYFANYITDQSELWQLKEKYPFSSQRVLYEDDCYDCQHKYKDPEPDDLMMFLHALRYKGPNFEFETPLPLWADKDWDIQ